MKKVLLCTVAASLLVSGRLHAQTDHDRDPPQADTAVRFTPIVNALAYGVLGIEASHSFGGPFAVEGTVGVIDLGHHTGPYGEVLGRFGVYGARHGLTVGAGPSVFYADQFGTVGLANLELGYEYRYPKGISVLLGVGPTIALNSSGTATCPESGWFACLGDKEHFSAGELGTRVRLGVGLSF